MRDQNRYTRDFSPKERREQSFRDRGFRDRPGHKPQQHYPQRQQIEEKPPEPSPINGKCNQLCMLFWCGKRAYQIRRDPSGRKFVFCTWIGDECIGASCQYASCKNHYLLPDGSCAWVKQKKVEETEAEKEDEFIVRDLLDDKAKSLISKKLGKKIKDEFL